MTKSNTWKLNWKVFTLLVQLFLCKSNFHLEFKGVKNKESANNLKVINQKDEQIEAFEEETKNPSSFMSISLNYSDDETIAPSTSKQTETVQSKSFSTHSILKKKVIKKKRSFFGTKSALKRRFRRLFVSKSAASYKRQLYVHSESELRIKYSGKSVNKKLLKVNKFVF